MTKVKAFKQMYEFEKEYKANAKRYGEGHAFTKSAEAEWFGAMMIIKSAGLYEDYAEYRMRKEQKNEKNG